MQPGSGFVGAVVLIEVNGRGNGPCGNNNTTNKSLTRKETFMIIVPVKEGENIDRVLKKLKRKFEKTGALRELRDRQKFTKPSVKRREEKLKAIYIQKLQNEIDA